jgi:hypothetical protein
MLTTTISFGRRRSIVVEDPNGISIVRQRPMRLIQLGEFVSALGAAGVCAWCAQIPHRLERTSSRKSGTE